MIHTAKIDKRTLSGNVLDSYRQGMDFDHLAVAEAPFEIPEGCMTGDEFERRVIEGLRKRLEENGYL